MLKLFVYLVIGAVVAVVERKPWWRFCEYCTAVSVWPLYIVLDTGVWLLTLKSRLRDTDTGYGSESDDGYWNGFNMNHHSNE